MNKYTVKRLLDARYNGINSYDDAESYADLNNAIENAGLSDMQTLCIAIHHGRGVSVRDTARALDIAPATVEAHLRRAYRRLAEYYENGEVAERLADYVRSLRKTC